MYVDTSNGIPQNTTCFIGEETTKHAVEKRNIYLPLWAFFRQTIFVRTRMRLVQYVFRFVDEIYYIILYPTKSFSKLN